jgi:hypothetical protein
MKPQDEFLLMKFAAKMSVVQPFTSDHTKIESFLRELEPDSLGTDLIKSVDDAIAETKKGKNRGRGVVVITDAEDNGGRSDAAMKKWIESHELPVYTVAIRPPSGNVSRGTGRVAVDSTLNALNLDEPRRTIVVKTNQLGNSETPERIVRFIQDAETDLRGLYLIGYASNHTGPAWERTIRINTVKPNLSVQMRRETLRIGESP